jgi:hypothetical protein
VTSPSNVIRDLNVTGCTEGVLITGEDADGNAVRGNTIYGNTPGAAAGAVEIAAGADNNTVGGTTAADRNIIRDNTGNGVYVTAATTTGNVIQGNCIGTQSTCSVAAPNTVDGVAVTGAAISTTVGGTAAGAGNTIAFNTGDGVDLTGAGVTDNIVTRNVMFLNTGLGINSAVVPLVGLLAGCADAGGGSVACSGTASAAGVIVDVYHANVDAGGPEGDKFLCTAIAGGGGAWGCTFLNPGGGSATATERTGGGNTSEFSAAAGIPAGPVITPTFTPTSTPTPGTPTPTGTPLTSTPTRTSTPIGGATATPTTGPMESVTLVGGACTPVASTYPNGTPVTTIAGAVTPPSALISVWAFQAGTWLGYSPQFPQASQTFNVDRLGVAFICVSSAANFSRPKI